MASFYHHFGKKAYWEEHYHDLSKDDKFDWFQNYNGVKDIFTQYFSENAKILNIGCGTSKMAEALYNEGYRFLLSIDHSEQAITKMQEFYNNMPKTFCFMTMDAKDMDFRDEMFSHAIDKGTLDAILSGYRSTENAKKYLGEVYRVLKPGGIFLCVSYRNVEHR